MQQTSSCPGCGSPIKPDQRFCGICGTKLTIAVISQGVKCPNCASQINPGQQFCGTCGDRISGIIKPSSLVMNEMAVQKLDVYSVPPLKENVPTTRIKRIPQKRELTRPGHGMLMAGAIIFQVLGWIILIGGCLGSVALIVLSVMGGGFKLLLGGGDIVGTPAMIIGMVCLVVSFISGFGLIVVANLIYNVVDIAKRQI